jgi:hypothetical protein
MEMRLPSSDALEVIRPDPSMRRWFASQPRAARRFYVGFYLYEAVFFAVVLTVNRQMWMLYLALAVIFAGAVAAAFPLQRRQRDQTWLYVTPDRVGYQGLRAAPREVPLHELRSVWRCCPLATRRWQSVQMRGPTVLLIGGLGRCRLRLPVASFHEPDVERFLGQLTVPVEGSFQDAETIARLEERFPGAFPWWMRHPFLLAWSIVGGCVILVTVGVAIALALPSPHG